MNPDLPERIFGISGEQDFSETALEVFRFQYGGNKVYSEFLANLGTDIRGTGGIEKIPFLPAEFFRTHRIITGNHPPATVFVSSGTTGQEPSRHYVADTSVYERSFLSSFSLFYGDPSQYMIAALLPSYTERENSSLVYMMDRLIRMSSWKGSGFYRDNTTLMLLEIEKAAKAGFKVFLMGVSFALMDLAEKHSPDLKEVTVMETGGMKGRRKEITRAELHSILKKAFNVDAIHSEYGMTELLSQAYSNGEGIFRCPPWMKILIRDTQDPLTVTGQPGITGGINIIDLANIHSCSFIATGDLGKLHAGGSFEVLGRIDNSDVRGCNLLVE
ncbi:MAG: acyltransferase [Bacteroidales bacterium]|jgi:phenylacetate-coenzyme A ligase PaaK-like adenylate-forming protein|nr:acyltransferase [Bacteroidales bacterium]